MEASRRDFLKNSALVGGVLAAAAMAPAALSGCSSKETEGAALAITGDDWDQEVDLVIIGSGMGGLACALKAQENGVDKVTVVEASRWTGGATSMSVGVIHVLGCGETEETFNASTKFMSDNPLSHKSFLGIPDLMEWLGSLGLPFETSAAGESYGSGLEAVVSAATSAPRGHMLDEDGEGGCRAPRYFFDCAWELFSNNGGTLLTSTAAKKVYTDDRGAVEGVLCTNVDGNTIKIKASQVVLAAGGFQNDSELKQRYLGRDAQIASIMSTPYSTGSGLRMALECGAALQGDMSHFAGHMIPTIPAKNWLEDVEAYEEYDYNAEVGGKWWCFDAILDTAPAKSIVVNANGERFVDEKVTGNSFESYLTKQPRSTGIIIVDDNGYNEWLKTGTWSTVPTMKEKMDIATGDECGGAEYVGNTIEELADALNASGVATHSVNKAELVRTVNAYNEACDAENAADLAIPRTSDAAAITAAPFHAIPVRPAIYCTFGGVAIDDNARVLDITHQPIRGLYATAPCAGGINNEYYGGSIAHAGVTGRWAADSAASALGIA